MSHPVDAAPDGLPPPPGLALVRLAAPLVPRDRRGDWLAEWAGELAWARDDAARRGEPAALTHLRLAWRALGALSDALWLRRRHGASDMLSLDVKYAARSLRRRPGFTAVVVLTLALGIGATTAIFSVVNGILLRPLAFPHPEQLVFLRGVPTDGDVEKVSPGTSYPDYLDYRAQTSSFSQLAATRGLEVTLTARGLEPSRVRASLITPNFLATLGITPVLGRDLVDGDDDPGAAAVTVVSHQFWQQRLGGTAAALGRVVTIDGIPTTVVGVMPPDVRLLGDTQLWLPLTVGELELIRGKHTLSVVGRLKPGVTRAAAEADARAVARRLELAYPSDNVKRTVTVEPLRETIVDDTRPALLVLLGAVTMVLLVGCANLASLFLARASARERETAVRTALGAGRGRLVRQWLTESLLLTLGGGAAGLLVAWGGMRALLGAVPRTIPRADEVALDGPVLLFLLLVSVVVGLAFGVLPVLQLRRGDPSLTALRDGGRGATAAAGGRRLRQALVVLEMAVATVLVVGAVLLLGSFRRLVDADPGFRPDGVAVMHLQLPAARYDSTTKVVRFYEQLRDAVAAIPGVQDVAVSYEHPLSEGWTSSYVIEGQPQPRPGTEPEARVRPVMPGYFRTMGVPLVAGRDIAEADRMGAPGAVVVNEAFVRRHFPGGDAVGRRLHRMAWWPGQPETWTIVGVVRDEPFEGLGSAGQPATYFSFAQFPFNEMWLSVRAEPAVLASLVPALRERVWRLDRDLPVEQVATMRELMGQSVATPRFNAALLALFALAALLLAAVGVYGVLSYTVAQRTGEIGVRLALGAGRGRVVRQVVGQGLAVALAGVALGVGGALALGRVLASLVVGVSWRDPLLLGGVAAALTAVALVAAWLPAWRASRIQPAVALRGE
ncbi:MAG TPA: ABC transporter permease [Gemmatimonadaceae bacterium]|nr:ABC transporter permease [Gemmatimonadaceae bacterium]